MSSNADTVWLVTGTSRGIGLEMTKQLLQSPRNVVLAAYRNPSKADALRGLIASAGKRLHVVRLDVSDIQSVEDAAREAAQIVGEKGIDYLINNAGVNPGGDDTAFSCKVDDLKEVFHTNLVGPAYVSQAGTVVSVSGTLGSIGSDMGRVFTSYAIVKAGLNMLTYKQAKERPDITVITICPGHLQTDMGGAGEDTLPVSVGVGGVIKVVTSLTPKDSGVYFNFQGERLPW
ncbi:hypothetical protein V8D89_012641 [Ganoderma adspersum]